LVERRGTSWYEEALSKALKTKKGPGDAGPFAFEM
jgi:hypothetical protein